MGQYDELNGIAIIGMAGRFPGADSINEFWKNLCEGKETISFFSDEELRKQGISQEKLDNPDYIKVFGRINKHDYFDADFFSYSPLEAKIIDPQQRIFLECAWESLENAGYSPDNYDGSIGVYAGTDTNTYIFNLLSNSELCETLGDLQILFNNDKDYLATRVSYKLDLKGPSVNVQSACSTSSVAVHIACQSLLNGECDMALAGGVNIKASQVEGYMYQKGGIMSADGHCRAFDDEATGTVVGCGLGIVVLKRYYEAIEDGDNIYAVIKGSAINNDGSSKIGYTAPSVNGQAQVIVEAAAISEVEMESISYIETHGTGTQLGDPIEFEALNMAYGLGSEKGKSCAIGSVKTNIGHLSAAAGISGIIKTALAIKNKKIPPSINFQKPNSKIDFDNSPFYVNTELKSWNDDKQKLRAGVSSFGIGGTNCHMILEQAQKVNACNKTRKCNLLVLSARTKTALDSSTTNLLNHLIENKNCNISDAAYTYQVGRKSFSNRRMLICENSQDAIDKLRTNDFISSVSTDSNVIGFMFSGQGSQYIDMCKQLYTNIDFFREQVDYCCEIIKQKMGLDLLEVIYPQNNNVSYRDKIEQTNIAQPTIFVIEYAMAKLLISLGIQPDVLIGHSLGEYTAACLAGVFSIEDGLILVAKRGELMQTAKRGKMLAVMLSEKEAAAFTNEKINLSVINGGNLCVLSGDIKDIEITKLLFEKESITCRYLNTSHAFHSYMMEPVLNDFYDIVSQVKLNKPKVTYISNVTGDWINIDEVINPEYWVRHLKDTVRFSDGIKKVINKCNVLIEVGPGNTLCKLIRMEEKKNKNLNVLSSIRSLNDDVCDEEHLNKLIGQAWLCGVEINWKMLYKDEKRRRIPLPSYPFEQKKHFIEADSNNGIKFNGEKKQLKKDENINKWIYNSTWKNSDRHSNVPIDTKQRYLLFIDKHELGVNIKNRFKAMLDDVICVFCGEKYIKTNNSEYEINPVSKNDYYLLMKDLKDNREMPNKILHFLSVTYDEYSLEDNKSSFNYNQNMGFYSLMNLVKSISANNITNLVDLYAISNNLFNVESRDVVYPEKTTIVGICKVIPQEYKNINCRCIDIAFGKDTSISIDKFLNSVIDETKQISINSIVAIRNKKRWVKNYENIHDIDDLKNDVLIENGVYLITGGLGEIGYTIAKHLADKYKVKLVLTGRTIVPDRSEWQDFLRNNKDKKNIVVKKIGQIKNLENLGAQVMYTKVNASNLDEMKLLIKNVLKDYGNINGIIHSAGIIQGKMIQEIEKNDCDKYFESKVYGTMVLNEVLKDVNYDFCILMSSLSSVLGGLGFSAYSAANICMDSLVESYMKTKRKKITSINWDGWNFENNNKTNKGNQQVLTIQPEEGIRVMEQILKLQNANQIVISTGVLKDRLDKWVDVDNIENDSLKQTPTKMHNRPKLKVSYIKPENDTQKKLADMWSDMLGISNIGIKDNFFDLGGHSLVAIQIISRIRREFMVELPIREMFEDATIENISQIIDRSISEKDKIDVLDEELVQIQTN